MSQKKDRVIRYKMRNRTDFLLPAVKIKTEAPTSKSTKEDISQFPSLCMVCRAN